MFYSPVRRGCICKVSVHFVQKYFPHDCRTDSLSCSKQGGKESDENNTKTRQQQDREDTVLLLATQYQGKSTLCSRFQSIGPDVEPLLPPSLSPIPCTCRLSSANASFVVVELFGIIFFFRRLRCRHISLGTVVKPPPPLLSSLIPRTRRLFLVLCRRLRRLC